VKLRDYKSSCADLIWIIKLASEANVDQISAMEEEGEIKPKISPRIGGNYSVFTKILVESRISLILLLILEGEFLQARDFVKHLAQDAQTYGIHHISLEVTLLETLVSACDMQDVMAVKGIHRQLWKALTTLQNDIFQQLENDLTYQQKLTNI